MALNGISTHTPKSQRRDLKMALAQEKRRAEGNSARLLNTYISPGRKSPDRGHPWEPVS